jgi:membrane associated rhomboid family serine protease
VSSTNRFPVVTLILIAANIAAAFASLWQPDLLEQFGFKSSFPSLRDALACMFLHANTLHLLGNMVFLAAVGPAVENLGGSWRLAAAYFVGGLAGVGAHWALSSPALDAPPLVGASGAVAACVALFTVRRMGMKVPLLPGVSVSMVAVTGAWIVLQVLGGFFRLGDAEASIAYWAHLGGVAAGLLLALVFRSHGDAAKQQGSEELQRLRERSPAAAAAAARSYLELHPDDLAALRSLAEACSQLGDSEGEQDAYLMLLDRIPESQQGSTISMLAKCGGLQRLPSVRRSLLAERFKQTEPEVAAELLRSVIEGPADDAQRPEAMLALAGLHRENNPEPAKQLVKELLETYPLHPAAEMARTRGWD